MAKKTSLKHGITQLVLSKTEATNQWIQCNHLWPIEDHKSHENIAINVELR